MSKNPEAETVENKEPLVDTPLGVGGDLPTVGGIEARVLGASEAVISGRQ